MKTSERIIVFGASGRVGRRVLSLLLERKVSVIAATHGSHQLPAHKNLSVVRVDIYDKESVERALDGATAVISTLGSWGTKRKDVLTVGMAHIIPAMQQRGLIRLVSLTGADARAAGDELGAIHRLTHLMLGIVAPKILRDGERHIALLEESQLKWTVIRSPIMSSSDSVGRGVLSTHRPLPWQRISRGYVAEAMVQELDDSAWLSRAPYII